jgi:hypothetical protein
VRSDLDCEAIIRRSDREGGLRGGGGQNKADIKLDENY